MQEQSLLQRQPRVQRAERRRLALRRFVARAGGALLLLVVLLAFFEWVLPALGVPAFLVPRPSQVLGRLFDPQERLAFHTGVTALAGVGGFLLGSLVAVLLAILFVHVPPVATALYPWVLALQTVPLVALAPLLVIWLGNGLQTRIVTAALFTLFPVLVAAARGMQIAERPALDLLRSFNATRWQIFWILRLPGALPQLFAGLKVGLTLAIIGALVSEFAGAGQGLGFVITVSTYHLETARTFAAITAAALLSMSLYGGLALLERRLVFWQRPL